MNGERTRAACLAAAAYDWSAWDRRLDEVLANLDRIERERAELTKAHLADIAQRRAAIEEFGK